MTRLEAFVESLIDEMDGALEPTYAASGIARHVLARRIREFVVEAWAVSYGLGYLQEEEAAASLYLDEPTPTPERKR